MRQLASPAKINLFLYVTGKRADGYHELFSLMCPIAIFDQIGLEVGGRKIEVECAHPAVPVDESNLVYQAAERFFAACDESMDRGVRIRIEKRIPVAAGLGGGSSNAAATLKGLNAHFGSPLSASRLSRIGLSIGADVPFFLFGKPALASGIGEQLVSFHGLPSTHLVVIYPGFPVSTASVFNQLNLRLTNSEKKPTKALLKNMGFIAPDHLHNDLETVALKAHPEIAAAKERLTALGAHGVLMSGSGPSVFGLFDNEQSALRAATDLSEHPDWQMFPTELIVDPAEPDYRT